MEAAIPAKMFVGNLNFKTTKDDLVEVLSEVGRPVDVFLPLDRTTGKPRGFAFVEFATEDELEKAIALLNGREVAGRTLKANKADERPRRSPGPHQGPAPARPRADFGKPRDPFPSEFASEPFDFDDMRNGRGKGSRRNLRAKKRSL